MTFRAVHLWLLLGLLLLVLVVSAIPLRSASPRVSSLLVQLGGELVDAPAPDFALVDLQGTPVSLESLRGQVVFLNFWASWCEPCREEMPSMQELARRLSNRNFVMLAVSLDEDEEAMLAFLREHALDPGLVRTVREPEGRLAARYGTERLPETWILDPDGHLVARFAGAYDWTQPEVIGFFEVLLRDGWRAR